MSGTSGSTGSGVAGNAGGGTAAANIPAAAQQRTVIPRGSNKPPRFEGTFELYRAELELYLGERQSWGIVIGSETRHATDQELQTQYDERDRFARATILQGLRGCQNDDATKVCSMATAAEMWASLVADKTQRNFSYAVLSRRQLYQYSHSRGESMAEYLKKMASFRQQLRNMGAEHAVTDGEMARLLLMGVAMTHRELIEQFDLPTRQGNPPTLQQVTNALRSRDERDNMIGQADYNSNVDRGNVVMYVNNKPWKSPVSSDRKKFKCFHCGKKGHLRKDCWQYKRKLNKIQGNKHDNFKKGKKGQEK